MTEHAAGVAPEVTGWRASLPVGLRPYTEAAPLAALFLGMSSGFPFAMIAATLSTRLAQSGIEKSTVTAFALTFLAYNFKWLWAPIIDVVKLPLLGRIGQRVSWLILCAVLVMISIIYLGILDPEADIGKVAVAAILVGVAGATFDIVIDAYRIELLEPHQLGVGSGMSQYGWRIGAALAGSLALVIAARADWTTAYIAVSFFGLFAVITGLVMGEPARRHEPKPLKGPVAAAIAYVSPLAEFFKRSGALVVLLFVLVHKIGDTLATLTLRLLFEDLGYTNDEVAIYDVGLGFWALLAGIFVGGFLYAKLGMKRSVLISLILMAVSNLAFAGLASAGHNNWAMAGAVGFENFASGIGGVCVVAYLSALCNLEFTATQFALLSAAASITGRFLTGTLAGGMIEQLGFANFYLVTTLAALPGVLLFWWMMASGLVDRSLGTAGTEESGE
ncbi:MULTISPECIES: AmpG family muropeptide MFS transporter [Blastomonas]|jgi:PAT family beta-lactamase induction signal transducer AmpG|uniref:AmpG family muropeptide MFS transporter n=1 Tax=Blastomonas TaxID=150203 RepID=UPI0006B9AD74|nr:MULTISPECIES: MFS transporter [Blastomonas]KPF74160.1 MFS transporter [Blastomonas sp. AAP25]MDM7927734.1 MFS transporter [Blastomonas fulva]MDM7965166.1 MFS transporter [Blastomonas fulva]